ncbi:MAG: GIY-YIG nuclease family protein [Oceanipulchritudo sp.]
MPHKPIYHYVYILRSTKYPTQTYVGYTTNLSNRLAIHNSGQSHHTRKYRPWSMETVIRFKHRAPALAFERYLKSHSGKAFAGRRLLTRISHAGRERRSK